MGTKISFSTNLELLNLFCYVFYNWFLILSVVNLITEKIYIIENKKKLIFPKSLEQHCCFKGVTESFKR